MLEENKHLREKSEGFRRGWKFMCKSKGSAKRINNFARGLA